LLLPLTEFGLFRVKLKIVTKGLD